MDHFQLGSNHVAADFTGDGRPDLAGIGAQSAAVLLNNGAGGFGPRSEYPVANFAQDLAAGDFNGDARLDLAVTINDQQTSLSLLMGKGNGTFAPAVNFANTSGFDSPAIVAVDLNNDARLDLVIAHQIACFTAPCVVSESISVMLGNGDGTFQPTREIQVGRGSAPTSTARGVLRPLLRGRQAGQAQVREPYCANQRAPSGPAVMAVGALPGTGNFVTSASAADADPNIMQATTATNRGRRLATREVDACEDRRRGGREVNLLRPPSPDMDGDHARRDGAGR